MANTARHLVWMCLALIMVGCANTQPTRSSSQPPAEVVERDVLDGSVLDGDGQALPDEPGIRAEPLPEQRSESPVVQRLLASAEQQSNAGDREAAANSLERALRIEPRNAVLWSRLADVRYTQGEWRQSIQFAAKSNTLSGENQALRRQNWYLMAGAYEALGDTATAEKFRAKLRQP